MNPIVPVLDVGAVLATLCAACGAVEGQSLSPLDLLLGVSFAGGVSLSNLALAAERDRYLDEWARAASDPQPPAGDPGSEAWENRRLWESYFRSREPSVWISYGDDSIIVRAPRGVVGDIPLSDNYGLPPPPDDF